MARTGPTGVASPRSLVGPIQSLRRRMRSAYWTWRVRRASAEAGPRLKVNGRSLVNRSTRLGTNVNMNGLQVIGPGPVTIGDNFHSGRGCVLYTHNHNHDSEVALPYDDTYVVQPVTIGDNVWLGDDVVVLPGVTIGEGAIIQVRSVVVADIPPLAIAGGHPCRAFTKRKAERYHRLKAAGRFH
jgi:chloramphenicol O-acetyltransferase type B